MTLQKKTFYNYMFELIIWYMISEFDKVEIQYMMVITILLI